MAQPRLKADQFLHGNIYSFPRAMSAPDGTTTALDLVYQAAEVFRELEGRARETEVRAQSLCRAASEKVRVAEMRAEAAERAHRELLVEADRKLQDASRALEQSQSYVDAQADRLTAAEFRAQAAEAEAREIKRSLALVEEAIRKRLLTTNSVERGDLNAVV